MLLVKYLLLASGAAMLLVGAGILVFDLYRLNLYRRALALGREPLPAPPSPPRWRTGVALLMLAWAPLLLSLSIVIVPSGQAGVRVSQTRGTRAGTLYPGVHVVKPLVERVVLFDTRDQLFTAGVIEEPARKPGELKKSEPLKVQAREGLGVGLAITVRYRLDPARLDHILANLPQPVETELVPPVVATAWRELVPSAAISIKNASSLALTCTPPAANRTEIAKNGRGGRPR